MPEGIRRNEKSKKRVGASEALRAAIVATGALLGQAANASETHMQQMTSNSSSTETFGHIKDFLQNFGPRGIKSSILTKPMSYNVAKYILDSLARTSTEFQQSADTSAALPEGVLGVQLSHDQKEMWIKNTTKARLSLPTPSINHTKYVFSYHGKTYEATAAHAISNDDSSYFTPQGYDVALRYALPQDSAHAIPISIEPSTTARLFTMFGSSSDGTPTQVSGIKIPAAEIFAALTGDKNKTIKLDNGKFITSSGVSVFVLQKSFLTKTTSDVPTIKAVSGGMACRTLSTTNPVCLTDQDKTVFAGQFIGYMQVAGTDHVLGFIQDGSGVEEVIKQFEARRSRTAGL